MALRMRVSISAIGSVIIIAKFLYQIRFNSTPQSHRLVPARQATQVAANPARSPRGLSGGLPTRFADTGNQTLVSQLAETNPANTELAVNRPRPAAHGATALTPNRILGGALCFRDF
jgi:hypothetical protein